MTKPTECKWCGAETIVSPRPGSIYFGCWTDYDTTVNAWNQDEACVKRMVAQAKTLREHIRHALAVLKSVERYDTDEVDPETWCGDDVAQAVDADCVDQVIRILEGESNDETE